MSRTKVLVLGGGFAGVEAAIYLKKEDLDVTLVSDRDYFYIYPTSIWIPTGEVTREDVSVPLVTLAMKHGFQLSIDPLTQEEAKSKKVTMECGSGVIDSTYKVVTLGQSKYTIKGMEYALSILV